MAPSPTDILTDTDEVVVGTFGSVFRLGLRGFAYSIFVFVLSIITGFIEIVQVVLRTVAGGAGETLASFLGGISTLITTGAITTANNFLLPSSFGFIEGLLWAFAGAAVINFAFQQFDTDIPFVPGLDIIPFFGGSEEEDDDS